MVHPQKHIEDLDKLAVERELVSRLSPDRDTQLTPNEQRTPQARRHVETAYCEANARSPGEVGRPRFATSAKQSPTTVGRMAGDRGAMNHLLETRAAGPRSLVSRIGGVMIGEPHPMRDRL